MSVTGTVESRITARVTRASDVGSVEQSIAFSDRLSLSAGTGSAQADLAFTDTRTIAASSNDDLDLAGGVSDAFGNTLTFVDIKAIHIKASAANTNNVVVGGGTNAFLGFFGDASDKIALAPGQFMTITAPAGGGAVTAGTGDILRVANSGSGSGVDYTITIFGASA